MEWTRDESVRRKIDACGPLWRRGSATDARRPGSTGGTVTNDVVCSYTIRGGLEISTFQTPVAPSSPVITDRVSRERKPVGSVRPSVCPFVSLYLLN